MSYSTYKYVRVLISGTQSAVLPQKFVNDTLKIKNIYINSIQNKLVVKNITLFSDYSFTTPAVTYTGIDEIYNSTYFANLLETITGLITGQDIGKTDINGFLIRSGHVFGELSGYKTLNPINDANIAPVYNILEYPVDGSIIGSAGKIIYPPYGFRNETYGNVFSGITTFSDYFYDTGSNTVSFLKDFPYLITGSGTASTNYTVIRSVSFGGRPPDTYTADSVILNGSGYMEETAYVLAQGLIKKYPLFRYNLPGFGQISGKLTGFAYTSNTGLYIFNELVTGSVASAEQFVTTGYINATGLLKFNSPVQGDVITVANQLNNTSFAFIYNTSDGFNPPIYFNSLETLSNIINSGSGDYNIISEYIDSTKMRILSTLSGESGNLTSLIGGGSTGTLGLSTGSYLNGGVSYYVPLTPTSEYSGIIYKEVYVTGYFNSGFNGLTQIQMTGVLANRPFSGLWNLFETNDDLVLNNVKLTGNVNSTGMFTNSTPYSTSSQNYKTIYVNYTNDPNITSYDIAKLTITMNSGLLQKSIILTGVQP